jgi:branched-chain amino acid transport system substrate-binding protein
MKGRLGSLGILVSVALLASAAGAGAQDIRIGVVYPFTGALGALGNAAFAGAEVAVEVVNGAGGVNGRKIVMLKADAPTPAEATNETQRLLTQENIKILIGSYSSSISLAASAVAERNQALWMEMGSMADALTGRNFRRTFRTSATTGQVAEQGVAFIVDTVAPALKVQPSNLKVAIIHEDSAFGTAVMDSAVKELASKGITPIIREPYSARLTDLSSLVLKLKSLNPDVVFATTYINDGILLVRQSKELGFRPKALIGSGGTTSLAAFYKALGNDALGLIDIDGVGTDVNPKLLSPALQKEREEFIKRYEAKTGNFPPSTAVNAYVSMTTLLRKALPGAGDDPTKIRDQLLALDEPIGSTINGWGLKYGANGQNTRALIGARQWQGSEPVLIWPQNAATAEPSRIPLPAWGQ